MAFEVLSNGFETLLLPTIAPWSSFSHGSPSRRRAVYWPHRLGDWALQWTWWQEEDLFSSLRTLQSLHRETRTPLLYVCKRYFIQSNLHTTKETSSTQEAYNKREDIHSEQRQHKEEREREGKKEIKRSLKHAQEGEALTVPSCSMLFSPPSHQERGCCLHKDKGGLGGKTKAECTEQRYQFCALCFVLWFFPLMMCGQAPLSLVTLSKKHGRALSCWQVNNNNANQIAPYLPHSFPQKATNWNILSFPGISQNNNKNKQWKPDLKKWLKRRNCKQHFSQQQKK